MSEISRDDVAHLAGLARSSSSRTSWTTSVASCPRSSIGRDRLAGAGGPRRRHSDEPPAPADQRLPRGRGPREPDRRGRAGRCSCQREQRFLVPKILGEDERADTDLTDLTALRRRDAAALAGGRDHLGRGHRRRTSTGSRRRRRDPRLPPRRRRRRAGHRGRRRPRRAAGEQLRGLAGVPIAVKDVLTTKGLPTTAARASSRAGCRRTTPPWSPGCARPACRSSARPTWTSSPWAPPPSTRLRPDPQPVGHRPHARRVRRRLRRRGRRPARAARRRHRHRRLDPPARRDDRHGRRQADLRRGLALGLIALASSLDQAGPVTRTVLDAALLHEVIGGHDPLDSTSHRPAGAAGRGGRSSRRRLGPAHRGGARAVR